MTNSKIKQTLSSWLCDRPAISIRKLESDSGIPDGTLRKYLAGVRPFPDHHKASLGHVLNNYGYNGEI